MTVELADIGQNFCHIEEEKNDYATFAMGQICRTWWTSDSMLLEQSKKHKIKKVLLQS